MPSLGTFGTRAASLALALALGAFAMPAQAQWKWRDAKGQIHVSDLPPPRDIPDKDVLQRPAVVARAAAQAASAASAPEAAKPGVDPELEARKRRAARKAR